MLEQMARTAMTADDVQQCVAQVSAELRQPLTSIEATKAASTDDTDALLEEAGKRQEEQRNELSDLQDLRDRVMLMDKAALREFATNNYRQTFGSRDTVDVMRTKAIGFIDQYGAV